MGRKTTLYNNKVEAAPGEVRPRGIAVVLWILLGLLSVVLFALNIYVGSVDIPLRNIIEIVLGPDGDSGNSTWRYIIVEGRLPQALTAALCGAALAVTGLMLQTVFRNPLAGPDVFGINSGAALGVAIVMLAMGAVCRHGLTLSRGHHCHPFSRIHRGDGCHGLIFLFSTIVRSNTILLIIGIMVGYVASSAIELLNFSLPRRA